MEPRQFLARLRHRIRTALLLAGAAQGLRLLVLVGGSAVLADIVWHLPVWLRAGWLLLLVLVLIIRPAARLRPAYALPMSDADLARLVEARRSDLDGVLIASVAGMELDGAERSRLGTLDTGSLKQLVPASRLPGNLCFSAGLLVIALLAGGLWSDLSGHALLRLFTPWIERPWPRADAISFTLPETAVPEDEAIGIVVQRDSGSSQDLRLSWRSDDGRLGRQEQRQRDGDWELSLRLPAGHYQLTAETGDALPAVGRIEVRRRPQLAAISARLTPPAYVGSASEELSTLAMEALPGSRIEIALRIEDSDGAPAEQVSAEIDGAAVDLTRQGESWRCEIIMGDEARDLSFGASDGAGIDMHPVAYRLRVRPDRPPVVRLSGPRPGESVLPGAELRLRVQASDDIGLATVAIEARNSEDEDEGYDALVDIDDELGRDLQRECTTAVPDDSPTGSSLLLRATAADGDDINGPHVATSAVLSLRVVSEPELRRELERTIAAERDRIDHARSRWQAVLASEEEGARQRGRDELAAQGKRSTDSLERLQQRWQANGLKESEAQPLDAAEQTLRDGVLGKLTAMDSPAEGQAVDEALAQAYQLLDGMLASGDLRRDLGQLIEQQRAVGEATREQVKNVILGKQDPEQLRDTARRQRELAQRMQEWERRLLQDPEHKNDPVAEGVSQGSAARNLHRAADALDDNAGAQQAVGDQREALERMQAWYEGLEDGQQGDSGGEQGGENPLVAALDELIEDHGGFVAKVDEGQVLKELEPEWQGLDDRSASIATQVGAMGMDDAINAMRLARQIQEHIGSSLQAGRRDAVSMGVLECVGFLQRVRDALQQRSEGGGDLMDLIRKLHGEQQDLVALCAELLQKAEAKELGFRDRERQEGLGAEQKRIGEAMRSHVQPQIADNPIVSWAVDEALVAIDAAAYEFERRKSALRPRSLELARAALVAIGRLIEVGSDEADAASGGNTGGGGGENGEQSQPPYPPRAALNMLRAAQERLARQTMSVGSPQPLEDQDTLMRMVEPLLTQTRPGTRPAQLLERSRASMNQAIAAIVRQERKDRVASWQRAAVGDIERLLHEMRMQMQQSGGGGSQNQQRQQDQMSQKPQSQGEDAQQEGAGGETEGESQGGGEGIDQLPDEQRSWLLQLQPAQRRRLLEAMGAGVPPEGIELYRRYMDLLEERLP